MKPIDIWLLVYPGFVLLDATGPAQVFSSANDEARDAGLPEPYRIRMIAPGGGLVASSAGVSVMTAPLPRTASSLAGSTLIVAGGRGLGRGDSAALAPATVRWVRRAALGGGGGGGGVRRCCSVCTGAFVLAQAGLLDGRSAVTHWMDAAPLRAQYPRVRVLDDAIYVKDGPYYTSAGIAAGMDLALS